MAWTAPHTWLARELANAGDPGAAPSLSLNVQLRDNLLLLATCMDTATGKFDDLTAATIDNLSGLSLTGVGLIASANAWTTGNQDFNGGADALILPVGANKWAT